MSAMGRRHVVIPAQHGANACCDRLLASVEMHESRDLALGKVPVDALLKLTDRAHDVIRLDELVCRQTTLLANAGAHTA